MTVDQKAILLFEYIIGGISTTHLANHLRNNYGIYMDHDEYEYVFIEYNINYNDNTCISVPSLKVTERLALPMVTNSTMLPQRASSNSVIIPSCFLNILMN